MKEFIKHVKYAWKYAKNQKKYLIYYMTINIFYIAISIILPIFSAKIIISLTNSMLKQLLYFGIIVFIINIFLNILEYFSRICSQIVYRETFINIQTELGKDILCLENSCIDEKGSGLFIQRLTGDASRLSEVFNVITNFLTTIITDVGIFVAIFIINKVAFLYMILSVLVLYYFENKRVKNRNENDKKYRKNNEKVTSFIGEIVRGSRDIKMLNSEISFMNELHDRISDLNKSRYKMQATDRKYSFISASIYDLSDLFLIILLVYLISNGNLIVANALVIKNYSSKVSNIIYFVGRMLEAFKDFNLSASRIIAIDENIEFKKEKFGDIHLDKVDGNFEFSNVNFAYKDRAILKNLSFNINKNETVAFVGKSGSGKTTIFNLLCKMYEINSGTIKIDGVDINMLDKDSIRGNITIISQNPYIFNLSIRDNLKLVKDDLTDEEMIKACKTACLDSFINSLDEGYDTIIGEGGVNLSGGQKQRLAIARALVQKTEIILFDEATSALDNETQRMIQKAIDNMKNEYTILIIAHRLSTIINSDRILFLNNGYIENAGTHEELLKKSKEYKKLYEAEIKNS